MLKPSSAQLQNLREATEFLPGEERKARLALEPLHVVDALQIHVGVSEGAEIALTENALLIRWPGTFKMIRLFYTEEINNYLVDLAYPALI